MEARLKQAFIGSMKKWVALATNESGSNCAMCEYVYSEGSELDCDTCPLSGPDIDCCGDTYLDYCDNQTKENAQAVLNFINMRYRTWIKS